MIKLKACVEVVMLCEAASEQRNQEFIQWNARDEFLARNSDSGFRQSSWYLKFKIAYNGWDHFTTVLKHKGDIVGGAVVFVRSITADKCYYYIPDGPVFLDSDTEADQEQVFCSIMDFIEGKRQKEQRLVSHLAMNTRWERLPSFVKGFRNSDHYYGSPRATQCVDLCPSETDILAQMKQKGRYNIHVAQKNGVIVTEDNSPNGIEDFLSIYEEMLHRKNIDGQSSDYFRTLVPMLSETKHGSIFFAEHQGARLATAFVVYSGRTATYYHGGSRTLHRNLMAPYLLHFEIMRKAKNLGYQIYDFFGVTPLGEPPDGWTDISVFKRKFGGYEIILVPTQERIYDPGAYQEWRESKRS